MKRITQITILILLALCLIASTSGCSISDRRLAKKMIEKYSDNQSYIAFRGEVIELDNNRVVIKCEDLKNYISYANDTCTYLIFADRVLDLNVGDMVDYVTVPFHFYNGHNLPIVELKRNGETLLTFEEGRENLLYWVNKTFNS